MSSMNPQFEYNQPKKSNALKIFLVIVGLLVLVCGGGAVACGAMASSAVNEVEAQHKKQQAAKQDGVKMVSCKTEDSSNSIYPHVEVELEIVNTTEDQQSYFIDLFIKAEDGTRLANGSAMVTDVRPGQRATHTEKVSLTKQLKSGTKVSCSIDKVS